MEASRCIGLAWAMKSHPQPSGVSASAAEARFLGPDEGERLNVIGDRVRVLTDGRSSGGRLLIFEECSGSGDGPPLHRHSHDDECFYILSGRYKFVCDGREFMAEPGAFVCAPRGSVHTFVSCAADGGESRMLIICTPPGLEGPFRECDAAGPGIGTEAAIAAFGRFDLSFVGPKLSV